METSVEKGITEVNPRHRFQWAASHLRCLPTYFTDHDISEALKEIPRGLEKTYEYMIRQLTSSMPPRNMRLCRRVFQMLLFSHRPLSLPELAVAISIEPGSVNLDVSTILTDPQSVLALGGPLVVYKPETNLVQFPHHTVREYLESLGEDAGVLHFVEADAHAEIAQTCLSYVQFKEVVQRLGTITFGDLQRGDAGSDSGDLAFVHYATKYWINHAQQTTTMVRKATLTNLLYTFFFARHQHFRLWQSVAEPPWDRWENGRQPTRLEAELRSRSAASAPMPAMSALSSLLMARRTASSAMTPNHLDRALQLVPSFPWGPASENRSIAPLHALHYLARINHPQCLSRAFSDGPRDLALTATGGPLWTTILHEAAKHGSFEFLEMALGGSEGHSRLDVNATDILGRTPLSYASQSGHLHVIKLLLKKGADMTLVDWYGSTPLHEAVSRSHHAAVACLISASDMKGPDANLRATELPDVSGEMPLSTACRFSDVEMVLMLTRRSSGGAIVGAVRACLRWGASPGALEAMVGTCSKIPWGPGKSPLQELVLEGEFGFQQHGGQSRLLVSSVLLDNGYPIDLEDSDGATALTCALRDGQEDMALMLLDRGARWSKALRSETPRGMGVFFINAVAKSQLKLALLLLQQGANWGAVHDSGNRFIELWAFATTARKWKDEYQGYASPVYNVPTSTVSPALHLLKSVLEDEHGMDINVVNSQGSGLLHLLCSSIRDKEGIAEIRWILSHGGDGSLRDLQSKTPLHCLCENREVWWKKEFEEAVDLLATPVRRSINDCLPPHGTPIHMLVQSSFGSERMPNSISFALGPLLKAEASLQIRNGRDETPLAMALAALTHIQRRQWSYQNSDRLLSAALQLAAWESTANALPSESGDSIVEGLLSTFGGANHKVLSVFKTLNLTPSQMATVLGKVTDTRSMKMFLDAGADVGWRDRYGRTPLYLQACTRGGDVCGRLKVLLEAGADPNVRTNGGDSVMDVLRTSISEARAKGTGVTEVEELLLRYGAKKLDIEVEATEGGWTKVDGRWMHTG